METQYTKSSSYLTISDLFCGAGGSSLGGQTAGGEVKLALNHWKLAVDTHNTNFPDTWHDCVDISSSNPRRYPATTILLASPECTHHSQARGKKREPQPQPGLWDEEPATSEELDRSRATMFDVPRYAECMLDRGSPYLYCIVENVVEVHEWVFFDDWLRMMQKLGYCWEICSLNSQHFQPVPQSRDRLYVVFWRRGNPVPDLNFHPRAYCEHCGKDVDAVQAWKNRARRWGRYGKNGQYVYRCPTCSGVVIPYYYAAANAIDWKLPMSRVGDRQKPLKPRTLHRIQIGLERFGPQSQLVELGHGSDSGHVRPLTDPYPTQTTAQSVGFFSPFIVGLDHTNGSGNFAHAVTAPWPTQTARQDKALVVPYIIELRGTGTAREVTQPLSTVTAQGNHHGLVVPPNAWDSFLVSYYGQDCIRRVQEAMGTITTIDRHALVSPSLHGTPSVDDVFFRMLAPHEIGKAMAFPDTYVVLGNNRQKTRLYGNAVTPPVMQRLVERCIATLQ